MEEPSIPSRFIDLPGSLNFRDFGGYRTRDGRMVKWRRLFRCGSLSMIETSAHPVFAELGISVICDLRRVDEAERSPTPAHAPFDVRRHIPIAPGSNQMLRESLDDASQSAEDRVRFMVDMTRELARDHAVEYQRLFEHLLDAEGAFLLHCSAGKDRTGFGAALILHALGVDDETIMADYLLTNEADCLRAFMQSRMRDFHGDHLDERSLEAITGVREDYLEAALEELHAAHGSIDAYLDEIGVDEARRGELRARLLT